MTALAETIEAFLHQVGANGRDRARSPAVVAALGTSPAELDMTTDWEPARWIKILDRIEHRQNDVGLRFWGPPLWLEVTMTGPDSDHWPAVSEAVRAWDWQSNDSCDALAGLVDRGADDERLLEVVGRYTIENLILNAVHEIGEWLRLDGRRLFPPHLSGPAGLADQGNGIVTVEVAFGTDDRESGAAPAPQGLHLEERQHVVRRLADAMTPSRFSAQPGTTISFEAAGPVVRRSSDGEPLAAWRSTWSRLTLAAARVDGPDLVALVGRDVHRALVTDEADRICRAFHVDGQQPWRTSAPGAGRGSGETDGAGSLSVAIDYGDTPRGSRHDDEQWHRSGSH